MFSNIRAQASKSAAGAAVLVVIIGLLIVLYMLLIPPDLRAQILGDAPPSTPGVPGVPGVPDSSRQVLLSYVPPPSVEQLVERRPLPLFTLRTETSGNVFFERSGLVVERSVFHSQDDRITFLRPENVQNVLLSFSVSEAVGRLRITLNGNVISDSFINQRQPAPIVLPANLLSSQNELVFSVSPVGFSFWRTNTYSLQDIRITGDVVSFSRAEQTQRFVVTDVVDVRSAFLEFYTDCVRSSGRLNIMHNGNLLYSGFPECGVPFSFELAVNRLSEGENSLTWSLSEGELLIDQPEVIVSRRSTPQQGVFSLSSQHIEAIHRGASIQLSLRFAQPGASGVVLLNDQPLTFRTQQQEFSGSVNQFIRQGANTIRIRESSVPVVLVEVYVG